MGVTSQPPNNNMKAFVCLSLLAYAGAAPARPVLKDLHLSRTTYGSVSTALGEVRTLSQSKAFGATHASVAQADNAEGLAEVEAAVHHAPVVARSLSSRLNTQQLNENPSDVRQKDRLPKENKSKYNIEQHSFSLNDDLAGAQFPQR